MTLSYEEVFEYFLGYITDYGLSSLNMQDAYSLMQEWLNKAIVKISMNSSLFSSYTNDREVMTLTFEMDYPTVEENDLFFVTDVLAKAMTVEWLRPQVMSKTLTIQNMSNSEKKFYSQSQHLKELQDLYDSSRIEVEKLIRDRGYIHNSYLGGNS